MPSTLENKAITFNPVYIMRELFKNRGLLRSRAVDLKTASEVKAGMQFPGIENIGGFYTKTTRNQKIQDSEYEELKYNARHLTWVTRFKGFKVDKEWEITQAAVNDPLSPLSRMITAKMWEEVYRGALAAALGDVQTGAPDKDKTPVTAVNDGVLTVDGTNGWTRAKFQEILENLYAQKYTLDEIKGAMAFISPTMNTAYLSIEQVMNRLYVGFNKNAALTEMILDTIPVEVVAGSNTNVDWSEEDEVLPTKGTSRSGVVLMPDALAMVFDDMKMYVNDDPTTNGGYVDSKIVVVEYRFGAMRKAGDRVMELKEQISA